jgi:phosphoglycerate kinase
MSHLGRPEGRDLSVSLEAIAAHLAKLLDHPVIFVDDCIGDKVVQAVKKSPPHSVIMLENVRFYKEEEANDQDFAKKLAVSSGARYFVQDCFGVAHRAHASIQAISLFLPSVAGFLLEKEYTMITGAMEKPKRPLVAVLGGAKIEDKIEVIERFVDIADKIIVGGAMANTFLNYKGFKMGASVLEKDEHEVLDRIYQAAHKKRDESIEEFIILPSDVAVSKEISPDSERRSVPLAQIGDDDIALDVGDESIERIITEITGAKTVIWNGTLGYAELPEFAHGSARLALELATHPEVTSIIGGGDTADFILKWDGGTGESFTLVSTGGGASLDLMAGKKLPGIECLLDARK